MTKSENSRHLKFLIVGLGSMGKRRIRNLQRLGYTDIIGVDNRPDRQKESQKLYSIKTYSDIKKSLLEKPTAMIISTPPDQHLKYAILAIKYNIPFFTELNLIANHVQKIADKANKKKIIACPSFTMRNHPVIKEIKKLVDSNVIGKIHLVLHHTGHYLPNWHPWEKPEEFFVSKKETGGAKELLAADLVWLSYVFPPPKSISGHVNKISKLKINADDVYSTTMKLENNIICNILIDVISIPSIKITKIIGERGTIICDIVNGNLKISYGKKWREIRVNVGDVAKGYKGITPPETLYEDEMRSFIDLLCNKKQYPYTYVDELRSLHIIEKIEKSSLTNKILHL
jgi:predicted dehydrogenase